MKKHAALLTLSAEQPILLWPSRSPAPSLPPIGNSRLQEESAVATDEQIQANQQNAQKSKGLSSIEGKAVSSQHRRTHGPTYKVPKLYLRHQTSQACAFYRAQSQLLKLSADRGKDQIGFERHHRDEDLHQMRTNGRFSQRYAPSQKANNRFPIARLSMSHILTPPVLLLPRSSNSRQRDISTGAYVATNL